MDRSPDSENEMPFHPDYTVWKSLKRLCTGIDIVPYRNVNNEMIAVFYCPDIYLFFCNAFLIPATGANTKLRYQITSGNKGGAFDIEPEVGTIFIAQPLDYEQQKRYKLLVLASDGKWEDYAAVVVTVVNKNDEAPVFSMSEYYGSVIEELDGSPVFVLQVGVCQNIDSAIYRGN